MPQRLAFGRGQRGLLPEDPAAVADRVGDHEDLLPIPDHGAGMGRAADPDLARPREVEARGEGGDLLPCGGDAALEDLPRALGALQEEDVLVGTAPGEAQHPIQLLLHLLQEFQVGNVGLELNVPGRDLGLQRLDGQDVQVVAGVDEPWPFPQGLSAELVRKMPLRTRWQRQFLELILSRLENVPSVDTEIVDAVRQRLDAPQARKSWKSSTSVLASAIWASLGRAKG